MKVSTDACVLGAALDLAGATRLLDIGTGTGLLALMAAQRHPTVAIEAVEIDPAAAAQAAANAAASPWGPRIRVHPLGLAAYAATGPAPFSHIVCNPPFFLGALRSPNAARTTARHAAPDTLTFAELSRFAADFLAPGGRLTVLLPVPEMERFSAAAAAAGLHPATRLALRHRPGGRVLRHIVAFGRAPGAPAEQALAIRTAEDDTVYSADFRALLAGFYLAP
ncbi:methyltransferase domain-containing protein [Hymenobacter nivis]|uniref:Methyltransferase domain-containing protein n=2 Tax=Hymenobacter nivis TaxID=1850093 RepID=A0A502GW30_9BACT|nr:methyltransferase domain-containing protein [Hymenobacter nivis]